MTRHTNGSLQQWKSIIEMLLNWSVAFSWLSELFPWLHRVHQQSKPKPLPHTLDKGPLCYHGNLDTSIESSYWPTTTSTLPILNNWINLHSLFIFFHHPIFSFPGMIFNEQDQEVRDMGYHKHAFNVLISNRLGYHRDLPDTRDDKWVSATACLCLAYMWVYWPIQSERLTQHFTSHRMKADGSQRLNGKSCQSLSAWLVAITKSKDRPHHLSRDELISHWSVPNK